MSARSGEASERRRVAVAGGSGLIGTELVSQLTAAGNQVVRLVRRPAATADERQWHPGSGWIDGPELHDVDAVICLSGAGVASGPWTSSRKQLLRESRVETTRTLVSALARAPRCRTFLSGSAVGYYGDSGEAELTETSPAGTGFLANLVVEWEALADDAPEHVRVACLRTGHVLSGRGGLLAALARIFRLGVGGRLGSGRQWMPWISAADHARAQLHLLDSSLSGPINLAAPDPVTNAEFTEVLASALRRPALLPTPLFPLRIVMGSDFVAELLLASQRVVGRALTDDGFEFSGPSLAATVRGAVQR